MKPDLSQVGKQGLEVNPNYSVPVACSAAPETDGQEQPSSLPFIKNPPPITGSLGVANKRRGSKTSRSLRSTHLAILSRSYKDGSKSSSEASTPTKSRKFQRRGSRSSSGSRSKISSKPESVRAIKQEFMDKLSQKFELNGNKDVEKAKMLNSDMMGELVEKFLLKIT